MFQRSSKIAASLAWVLFWTLMVLVAVEDYRRDGGSATWQPVLWETSSACVATVLFLIQRHFTRRHDALVSQPLRWFALQARWLPLYWFGFTPVVFAIRHAVYALLGATYRHEPWSEVFVYEALKISLFAGLFTTIGFGLLSYRELLGARLRAEQANALLREAQQARLNSQMQPHFLFNALNTISSLMHSDVARRRHPGAPGRRAARHAGAGRAAAGVPARRAAPGAGICGGDAGAF